MARGGGPAISGDGGKETAGNLACGRPIAAVLYMQPHQQWGKQENQSLCGGSQLLQGKSGKKE